MIIILITMTNRSNIFFFRPWVSWFLLRGLRGRMKCEGNVALQDKIFSMVHFKWGVITNVTQNNIHPYCPLVYDTPCKCILILRPCQESVSSVYVTAIADCLWHVVFFWWSVLISNIILHHDEMRSGNVVVCVQLERLKPVCVFDLRLLQQVVTMERPTQVGAWTRLFHQMLCVDEPDKSRVVQR